MKTLSPLAVLLSALLLQSCVTIAVVGTAAVGTKTATDLRTMGTQVDDSTPGLHVGSTLSEDGQIKKQARINVTACQGKALLTSQSPIPDSSARAKQIAMNVGRTTEVFNGVRQGQSTGLGTTSSDTWITTEIYSQLLNTDQVKSSNIGVTTKNSEVFLMGLATEHEDRAAANIASRMSGASRVVTAFAYVEQTCSLLANAMLSRAAIPCPLYAG